MNKNIKPESWFETWHGCKLKTVESCFETFNRKQQETFQRKNVRMKTEKIENFPWE